MTTASEVVALQADMLDMFFLPHPDYPGVRLHMELGGGGQIEVPRSQMGDMIDLEALNTLPDGIHIPSLAPAIACGLTLGRAYRVQENMSVPIAERADAMAGTLRIFDDIKPPSASGFVWFDEPIPHEVHGRIERDDPGFSAITWTCAVDDRDDPRQLVYVVTLWADLYHRSWWDAPPKRFTLTTRFCPVAVVSVRAGTRIGRPVIVGTDTRTPVRLVAALWQMLTETLPTRDGERVEHADEDVDRRAQRRARRSGIDAAVTTVVLRRESRPTRHPGSGTPWDSKVWIDEREAWRWIGSGDTRRKVRRNVRGHWSVNNDELPVRDRRIVSELRR